MAKEIPSFILEYQDEQQQRLRVGCSKW